MKKTASIRKIINCHWDAQCSDVFVCVCHFQSSSPVLLSSSRNGSGENRCVTTLITA